MIQFNMCIRFYSRISPKPDPHQNIRFVKTICVRKNCTKRAVRLVPYIRSVLCLTSAMEDTNRAQAMHVASRDSSKIGLKSWIENCNCG